jgi:hypothetical protein
MTDRRNQQLAEVLVEQVMDRRSLLAEVLAEQLTSKKS